MGQVNDAIIKGKYFEAEYKEKRLRPKPGSEPQITWVINPIVNISDAFKPRKMEVDTRIEAEQLVSSLDLQIERFIDKYKS